MGLKRNFEEALETRVARNELITKTVIEGMDALGVAKYAQAHEDFDAAVLLAESYFELEDFINLFRAIVNLQRKA